MPRARKVSPNRTDLLGVGPLPVTTGPSQQYGERAQEQASQRALPMAPTPIAPGPPPAAPGGAPATSPLSGVDAALQAAQAHNGPGDLGALDRPTERPNEPVTHGLPNGPGGGPEVLTGVGAAARSGAVDQATLGHLLGSMTATPGATTAVVDLAQRLQQGAA